VARPGRSKTGPQPRQRQLLAAIAGATWLTLSPNVAGCPRCTTSVAVRAMAFGPTFWPNVLATSLPFVVMAALCLAWSRIATGRARR